MEAVVEGNNNPVESTFVRRRWYHRRDLRFLALVAVFAAVFYSYGYITGPQKISPALAAKFEDSHARLNIEVLANFPPEAFHMSIFQDVGRMRGTKGNIVTLYRVLPKDISMLSRKYWIQSIRLAPPLKR